MRKRTAVEGLTSAVGEIAGALRRRREDARPRVRVRFGREQAVVLGEDDPAARAILGAARELVEAVRLAPAEAEAEAGGGAGAAEAEGEGEDSVERELEALAREEASALPEPGPPAEPGPAGGTDDEPGR